jgi:hypothetical protein
MGIAAVVRVLKAESLGRPWSFPPSLKPRINESKKQTFIDKTENKVQDEETQLPVDDRATSIVGLRFIVTFLVAFLANGLAHSAEEDDPHAATSVQKNSSPMLERLGTLRHAVQAYKFLEESTKQSRRLKKRLCSTTVEPMMACQICPSRGLWTSTGLVWAGNELYVESIQDESQRIPDLDLQHSDNRWEVERRAYGLNQKFDFER